MKLKVLVAQLCPTLCDPLDCSLPGYNSSPGKNTGVAIPFSRHLLDPGIEPGSPALQADSLLSELPGKPQDHISHCQFIEYLQRKGDMWTLGTSAFLMTWPEIRCIFSCFLEFQVGVPCFTFSLSSGFFNFCLLYLPLYLSLRFSTLWSVSFPHP